MDKHLITKAADWFADQEQWTAFLELSEIRQDIQARWFTIATDELRTHFVANPAEGWSFCEWGRGIDTWWYLTDMGDSSIGFGFGWNYLFTFGAKGGRVDRQLLSRRIGDFPELREAFGAIHRTSESGLEWLQERGFHFDGLNDGRMPESELAWHAGHNRNAFLEQAIAKVERFVRDPKLTATVRQLNQELIHPVNS